MSGIDSFSDGILGGTEITGRSTAIGGAAQVDIWAQLADYSGFPESTTPVELFAVSTSADDDLSVPGIGLQKLECYVLRSAASKSYEKVEVDLEGTVEVSIGECYRCILCRGTEFGSSGSNVGTVTVGTTGGAVIYSQMEPGFGRSQECVYTVPAGLPVDLRRIRVGVATGGGTSTAVVLSLKARTFGSGGFRALRTYDIASQTGLNATLQIPLIIEPLTDLKVRTNDVSDADTNIDVTLDFGP